MVPSNDEYLSNSLTYVYKPQIGQRTKYTANTGTIVTNTANSNLDGTGTLYTVMQSGTANGTLIKTITLKAQGTTTRGMIRLYVEDGSGNIDIIAEVEVPAVSQASGQQTWAISMEVDYMLKYQYYLKASTQNTLKVTVVAEGLDITFP